MIKTILITLGILFLIESLIVLLYTKPLKKILLKLKPKELKTIGLIELLIALTLIIIGIIIQN